MANRPYRSTRAERGWLSNLTPGQQVGYGCLVIIIIGATVMYCAGTISLAARPLLLQRSTATEIIPPTLAATPTQQAQPTFINLPTGVLLSTPTQAPVPTREPSTTTPTVDLTNPAPLEELTPPLERTNAAPSRRPTETATP